MGSAPAVGQPSLTFPSPSSSVALSHWPPDSGAMSPAGQPSLTFPSLSSSVALSHWAPVSGLGALGQPSLTLLSPSSSVALRHWAPVSPFVSAGQPSLTNPSKSSSVAFLHCFPVSGLSMPEVGQPSLTLPSSSSSRLLLHCVPDSGSPSGRHPSTSAHLNSPSNVCPDPAVRLNVNLSTARSSPPGPFSNRPSCAIPNSWLPWGWNGWLCSPAFRRRTSIG